MVGAPAYDGDGDRVQPLALNREGATVGSHGTSGRGAYVGPRVSFGDNWELQNYALVYGPAILGDGVYVGPAAVLTNDLHPRAITPEGRLHGPGDWGPAVGPSGNSDSLGRRVCC